MTWMGRALAASMVLHAAGIVVLGTAVTPHYAPPKRISTVPIDFIPLAAPAPARVERSVRVPRSSEALAPSPQSHPREQSEGRTAPGRSAAPIHHDTAVPSYRHPQPSPQSRPVTNAPAAAAELPKVGRADDASATTATALPRVGDRRVAVQLRVEGDASPYAYYLSVMETKIAQVWDPPPGVEHWSTDVSAALRFRIEAAGAVSQIDLEESSGIGPYDDAARRALENAFPLPPLPLERRDDFLVIHLRFVHGAGDDARNSTGDSLATKRTAEPR